MMLPLRYKLLFSLIVLSIGSVQAFQDNCDLNAIYQELEEMEVGKVPESYFRSTLQNAERCFGQLNEQKGRLKCRELRIERYLIKEQYGAANRLLEVAPEGLEDYPRLRGTFYFQQNQLAQHYADFESALKSLHKAAHAYQQIQAWKALAKTELELARVAYQLDINFREVVQHLHKAEEIIEQQLEQNPALLEYIYQYYGSIYFQEGNYDKAIDYTKRSLDEAIKAEKPDSNLLATLRYDMGLYHEESMDLEQALTYYQSALSLFQKHRSRIALIELYRVMGDAYRKQNKKQLAYQTYNKCLELSTQVGWNPEQESKEEFPSYLGVVQFYRFSNNYDKLLDYLLPKLSAIERYKLDVSSAYKYLGYTYEALNDSAKAELYMRKTLEYNRKRFGNHGPTVANDYLRLSILFSRFEQLEKSLTMLDSVLLALQIPDDHTKKSLAFEHALDHQILKNAYKQKGEIHLQRKSYDQAHESFELAISLLHYLKEHYASNASKQYTVEALRPLYESATQAAFQLDKQGKHEDLPAALQELVFEYAENSKATLLNESILKFRSRYYKSIGIPDSVLMQEEFLLRDIDDYREELFSATQRQDTTNVAFAQSKILNAQRALEDFEIMLNETYPDYRSMQELQHEIAHISAVQAYLDENTLLIEYFISEDQAFIFYISKDKSDLKIMENHSLKKLRGQIKALRMVLTDLRYLKEKSEEGFDIFTDKASYLYKEYVDHPLLEGKKRLVIIPDREFNYIPFELLLTKEIPKDAIINYQQLPYLIKDYIVRYEYSATVMMNHKDSSIERGNGRVLGFAPMYEQRIAFDDLSPGKQKERTTKELKIHNSLKNLEGAQKELRRIQTWSDGDFFYKQQANEALFKRLATDKTYSVIHLAMHGIVDFDHPAFSAVVFTEDLDSLNDNLLYAYEINHLDLRKIELVVLSACQTGYGKYALGEGVVSIGRSFMHAGVPSILSTLWELNDQSSLEIMKLFYKNLSEGMEKDQALRDAKLAYIEAHDNIAAHPFFWAGMIQIGDPAPIKLHFNRGLTFLGLVLMGMFVCLLIGLGILYHNTQKKKRRKLAAASTGAPPQAEE